MENLGLTHGPVSRVQQNFMRFCLRADGKCTALLNESLAFIFPGKPWFACFFSQGKCPKSKNSTKMVSIDGS